MPYPGVIRPDLCSIRAAAGQAELAETARGGPTADGHPPAGDDPPAPLAVGIDRAIRLSTVAAVLAVAGIAAYVSYWHAFAVTQADQYGDLGALPSLRVRGQAAPRRENHRSQERCRRLPWQLRERAAIDPHSTVPPLDTLLAPFRTKPAWHPKSTSNTGMPVRQDSHLPAQEDTRSPCDEISRDLA